VAAGLKESGQPDVAVVLNDGPSRAAAAVFTSNRVQAAPVLWTRQVVSGGRVRAVVLNSGGANACTGAPGFQDTHATAEHLAQAIDDSPGEIAVCSTGLIGERLPMDKLLPGVDAAVATVSRAGGLFAADAIRTTDTVVKIAFRHGGTNADRLYTIGGMAKGAGMLAPALATMLCVLTTDADLGAAELDEALRSAVAETFDRLDTDGCMSTNDTVLLMASGATGVHPDLGEFTVSLTEVCADLARQLQLDAEGAQKMIAIEVIGAEQPGQVRHRRRRPQLGPDPGRGRDHRRGLRAGPAERGRQRRVGLPPRRRGRRAQQGRPDPEGRHDHRRPVRRPAVRHHLDHRPDHRLRPREQCLFNLRVYST
jgi:glutamate N-acetyltransferase/amino-acid N-acetyltransferase